MKKMKINILILSTLLLSTQALADWTDVSITEPSIGCLAVGGIMYMSGQNSQMSMIGCMVGAGVGYTLERYYTNKASDKYERELKMLKSQFDEVIYDRAVNNSLGVKANKRGIILKETMVPAQEMPDGSWQLETINIKATLPGKGLILGD